MTKRSIHGNWIKRPRDPNAEYLKIVSEAYLHDHFSKEGTQRVYNSDKPVLLVHHWYNYYHWLTESILRLWWVKDRLEEFIILLPEAFQDNVLIQDSLKPFKNASIEYVSDGLIWIKNLCLVENKPYNDHYFPSTVKEIGQYFASQVSEMNTSFRAGERIYISRRKATRRRMENEEDVEKTLMKYGFQPVCMEDYSFYEQVAIMGKVKYLVSMHGAGLTNMMFMPSSGKVLELHREVKSTSDHHSVIYWKLASALKHEYLFQFCEVSKDSGNFFTDDLSVSIPLLKSNIEIMLRA